MAQKTKENITHYLWGEGFEPTVNILKSAENPVVGAGKLANETIQNQEMVANGVGMTIPQSILLQLGGFTVEELFEVMETAKIYSPPTPEHEQIDMNEALNIAIEEWMAKHGDKIDPAQAEATGMDLISGAYDTAMAEPGMEAGVPPQVPMGG
jgi:hypothetical protein